MSAECEGQPVRFLVEAFRACSLRLRTLRSGRQWVDPHTLLLMALLDRAPWAALLVVGCDAGSFATPDVQYVEASCESCSADRCAAEVSDCASDEACRPILDCAAACALDEAGCRFDCVADRNLPDTWRTLDACRHDRCAGTCIGPTVTDVTRPGSPECLPCLFENCKAEFEGCLSDASCDPMSICISRCDDPACLFRCVLDWGTDDAKQCSVVGYPALDAVIGCLRGVCAFECDNGKRFACVDDYEWDRFGGSFRSRLRVTELSSLAPLVDVAVRACPTIGDCSDPERTDSDGEACVDYPAMMRNGFSGTVELTGEGFMPSLLDWSYPLTSRADRWGVNVLGDASIPGVESAFGEALDASRGHLYAQMWDCSDQPAPEVTFRFDGDDPDAYLSQGAPNVGATRTDVDGIGASINLPPGPVSIVARRNGEVVACMDTEVRAGWLTGAFLFPRALGDAACPE